MLKLKMIDLLIKNDKIHKKLLGERMLCSIRNLSDCVKKRRRVGMGGWMQFGRGELGWERRRRNRGLE